MSWNSLSTACARWFALGSLPLLAAACSGEIASPAGASGTCLDCGPDGVGTGTLPGDLNSGSSTRPSAGEASTPDGVGWSTRFPKLSNRQWDQTVQTLFYLDAPTGFSSEFTQEPRDKAYESLAAAELTIGGDAWLRYQTAAEKVADLIVSDDAKLAKIVPSGTFADAKAKGAAFISSFGTRAFRRPLTNDEKSTYGALFALGPDVVGGDAFKAGARLVIEAMLQSVHFLYRVEATDKIGSGGKIWLSGYEIATRLSYALWGSMPSDELLTAAGKGELDSKEGIARWAGKLLDNPRANEILLAFHEQTFDVAAYGTQDKDASLNFATDSLAPVLREEARKFFELVVVKEGGGIEQLLTEPSAFVNEDTAPLYGISGVTGKTLQQRSLDPAQRAGLLSQLGFLTKNATRTTSDPVHRGLVVLRKVLCDEPDPPPMTFQLPTPTAGLTTRETYEKATACGKGCHDTLINPPGFAFEVFDVIGRVRSSEAGKPINASGTLSIRSGYTSAEKRANPTKPLSFDGPVDLVSQLAITPRVHECYARNWMQYVLAHELDPVERGAWESLRDTSLKQSSTRSLLVSLVQLDTFRARVAEAL